MHRGRLACLQIRGNRAENRPVSVPDSVARGQHSRPKLLDVLGGDQNANVLTGGDGADTNATTSGANTTITCDGFLPRYAQQRHDGPSCGGRLYLT